MALMLSRVSAFTAALAAVSLAATPAAAHDRWHRHRGGIDGGDLLAGVLVLGGIAAIASAASKSSRDRDYRDDGRYREPYPYRGQSYPSYPQDRYNYREPQSRYNGGGIDNAVDMCVGEVERGRDRVESVDNASRTADGWQISGELQRGGGFSCSIDNDGRIRDIDIGGDYRGSSADDENDGGQWNDDDYARARAHSSGPEPYGDGDAYPG